MSDLLQYLQSLPYTREMDSKGRIIEHATPQTTQIAVHNGRPIVQLNINGIKTPFYQSTGNAGKANVPFGQWFNIFGATKDGWIMKGTQHGAGDTIQNYYNSKEWRDAARYLDSRTGNIVSDRTALRRFADKTGIKVTNVISSELPPHRQHPQGRPADATFLNALNRFSAYINPKGWTEAQKLQFYEAIKQEKLLVESKQGSEARTQLSSRPRFGSGGGFGGMGVVGGGGFGGRNPNPAIPKIDF